MNEGILIVDDEPKNIRLLGTILKNKGYNVMVAQSGMDAISILENMGLEVEVKGNGKVKKQSISKGTDLKKVKKIILELS